MDLVAPNKPKLGSANEVQMAELRMILSSDDLRKFFGIYICECGYTESANVPAR